MNGPEHLHAERAQHCPVGVIAYGGKIVCYSIGSNGAAAAHELGGEPLQVTLELQDAISADRRRLSMKASAG